MQQVTLSVRKVRFQGEDTMIVSIFVTILCGAFSLAYPQSSDSVLRLSAKRNARLQQGTTSDYQQQVFDGGDSLSLEQQIDPNEPSGKTDSQTLDNIITPQRLWSLHCEPNCPPEFNPDDRFDGNPVMSDEDDILLHLSADKDLMTFLQWTLGQLGSFNAFNASADYYPGMNMWKKLNLSGRREMPLYVEEPKYIVVRREQDHLDPILTNPDIPFIPPRGRKYSPNLENLMARNELFYPHRGKKDKIKDIFKYDELFFPHRGKKRRNENDSNEGRIRIGTSDRYYYQLAESDRKKLHQPFDNCLTGCDDIPAVAPRSPPAAAAPSVVTNQAENINGLVSAAASTLQLPPQLQVSSSAADVHQDDDAASGCGAAGAVAECQKENDVKINGFDQSVKAQIHQRQHFKGGARAAAAFDRRMLPSSVEAGASSFLPLIRPDQVRRLLAYPIRNKQWRSDHF